MRRIVRFVDRKEKKLTSDVRPVFPEERLLLEIILEKPFAFEKILSGTATEIIIL